MRPSRRTTTIRAASEAGSRSSSWSPLRSRSDRAGPAVGRVRRPRSAPGSGPTSGACLTSTRAMRGSRSRSGWRPVSGRSSGRLSAAPFSVPSSSTATMSSRRSSSRRSSRRSSPTRSSARSRASRPIFGIQADFGFSNPAQLGWYALIGLACGAVGLLYINNFYGLMDRFTAWRIPRWLKPAIAGFLVGCMALVDPRRPRHGLRLPPGRPRPADPARDPALDGPAPAIREDPRDIAIDRFRRLGWHLRAGDVHRRHARGRDLAPARADRTGHPDRPCTVRDRRDDGPVRQRRPRPARGDADGRRDDG